MADLEEAQIPDYVLESIRGASSWEDGDTWVLGQGRILEYHFKTNAFQVKESGNVVRSIPFRKMMRG